MTDVLVQIYNAIDPFQPLEADDPAYVDCQAERGDTNVVTDLRREILRSNRNTCQLFAGHRGAGKSTELKRLEADLKAKGFFVVYFTAVGDDGDIDPTDVEYADILLACARHLLEDLKNADPQPLISWFRERGRAIQDLLQTQIEMDSLDINILAKQFAALTATIRAVPTERKKIRDLVNPHTVTLVKALNDFIADARRKLPSNRSQIVVIADNLDRIVPLPDDYGHSNHDEIYLDRSEQLKGLDCHIIYTVPISMVYSNRANDLKEIYGNPEVLPMIMVQTPDGAVYQPGVEKMRQVILRRIEPFIPGKTLETDIFETSDIVRSLCLASGGHVRELLLLVKEAINKVDTLPISAKAVRRAIAETRENYRRTVEKNEWQILAKVADTRNIDNDDNHRDLLFRRCVLEYRYYDENDEMCCWYDVHPLIKAIQEFKEALSNYRHDN